MFLSDAYRARNDHRRRSECQQRASRLGGDGSKSLLLAIALAVSHVGNTAKDKAHAHHKQAVGQDGTNHGGLDNFVLAIAQRNDANLESHKQNQHRAGSQRRRTECITYNQLDRISKRGIQQTTQSLAQLGRDFLSRKRQYRGERNDCEEVDDENGDRVPLGYASDDTNGDEYEEDIDIVYISN